MSLSPERDWPSLKLKKNLYIIPSYGGRYSKSSTTAENYIKTYHLPHLSKLRAQAGQEGYLAYPGSRGNSPTYSSSYTPTLAKGTPSIYQSSVGFQRWNWSVGSFS